MLEGEGTIAGIRWIILAALLSLAVLAATGCGGGGDGDSGDSGDTTVSKAVFIREADTACKKAGEQGSKELKAFLTKHKLEKGKEPNKVQLTELGKEVLLPLLEQQQDDFKAIGTPRGDQAEIETLIEALGEAIENLKKEPTLAASSKELLKRVDRLARGYGFKVCGNR